MSAPEADPFAPGWLREEIAKAARSLLGKTWLSADDRAFCEKAAALDDPARCRLQIDALRRRMEGERC